MLVMLSCNSSWRTYVHNFFYHRTMTKKLLQKDFIKRIFQPSFNKMKHLIIIFWFWQTSLITMGGQFILKWPETKQNYSKYVDIHVIAVYCTPGKHFHLEKQVVCGSPAFWPDGVTKKNCVGTIKSGWNGMQWMTLCVFIFFFNKSLSLIIQWKRSKNSRTEYRATLIYINILGFFPDFIGNVSCK